MRLSNFILLGVVGSAGLLAFACGSSDTTPVEAGGSSSAGSTGTAGHSGAASTATGGSTGHQGGTTGTAGHASGTDGSTTGTGGSTPGAGGAPTCKAPTLHPGTPGMPSLFCPFDKDANGKSVSCNAPTEHCCEGAKAGDPSACTPAATACPAGDTDWGCQDAASDCTKGQVCCAQAAAGKTLTVAPDTKCPMNDKLSGLAATKCAASCGAAEIEICESDAECSGGKKCKAVSAKGAQFGVCQ